jgi:hypothetical protein
VQKLDSIAEFRTLILNSDTRLKSQKIIVRLKKALSAAIKQSKTIVQKGENEVCGDITYESDDIKSETDGATEDQSGEHESEEGARHKGCNAQKSDKKLLRCEECVKTFRYKYQYVAHNRRHTGDMPYHCDICNKGFPMKYLVVHHRRIHLDERPFKCDECAKAFKYFKK